MLGPVVRDVHARRVGRLAARARERRTVRAPARRRGRRRQHRARPWLELLRRRERAGRGDGRPRCRDAPTSWPSTSGRGPPPPPSWEHASAPRRPDTGDEFERRCAPPPRPTSPWSWWAPTGNASPRATTAPTSRCPDVSVSWSRRCSRPTPAPWWSSTPAPPSRCPGRPAAGAVLMTWYPGEEGADALADMLVGLAEPSGRLPVTFPARAEDGPAGSGVEGDRYPGIEGKVVYGEGVLVGYRFYETTRLAPLFPFGFGLSYGDFVLEDVRLDQVEDEVVLRSRRSTTVPAGAPRSCRCTCGRRSPSSGGPSASSSGLPKSSSTPAAARPCECRWARTPSATGTTSRRTRGAPTPAVTSCSWARRPTRSGPRTAITWGGTPAS